MHIIIYRENCQGEFTVGVVGNAKKELLTRGGM